MPLVRHASRLLRDAWSWLRQVSGDAAYENYVRYRARASQTQPGSRDARIVSEAEFYLETLQRRYSKPSRCC